MNKKNLHQFGLKAIFVFAIFLRFILATVNQDANDPHIEVISMMVKGVIPQATDCWMCYHPKLYHFTCAVLIRLLDIETVRLQILLSGLINAVAGSLTLLVFYRFLAQIQLNNQMKVIAFALVALNPKLIGINAQVTNDSFVILLATLSIYHLWQYFGSASLIRATGIAVFAALAGITKGSGLVLFAGIMGSLFANLLGTWVEKSNLKKKILALTIIFVIFFSICATLGSYYSNYKILGSPLAILSKPAPTPHFFKKTVVGRPGVTSIFDAYFTFRLIDLIRMPHINNEKLPFSLHRTSVWSQIYGRTYYVHFDYWPPRWSSDNPFIINIGRAALIFGLVPTLLVLIGFIVTAKEFLVRLCRIGLRVFCDQGRWIFLLFTVGFILMLLRITFVYRGFAFIKAIYIFPALICFMVHFIDGVEYLGGLIRRDKAYLKFVMLSCGFLLVLFVTDIMFLWLRLSHGYLQKYFGLP